MDTVPRGQDPSEHSVMDFFDFEKATVSGASKEEGYMRLKACVCVVENEIVTETRNLFYPHL